MSLVFSLSWAKEFVKKRDQNVKKFKFRATRALSHGRATRPNLCRNSLKNSKAIDAMGYFNQYTKYNAHISSYLPRIS